MDEGWFVGRGGWLGGLRAAVEGVARGAGGVVLVTGEQGVGKSALLAEGLAAAAGAGCRVAWGTAEELDEQFPLWLMARCLGAEGRAAVAGGPVSDGGGLVAGGNPVLAGVERVLGLLDYWCAVAPVVLVAEDLQWADAASLLVWERLVRAAGQLPLLLVGSCRPAGEQAGRLMRQVGLRDGVMLELGPLGGGEVAALAEDRVGGRPGGRLARGLARAGGNPLYVRELLDALVREGRVVASRGVAELAGEAAVAVPVSLQAAIGQRLAGLDEPVARMLRWAAVLGAEFSAVDLSVVAGVAVRELAGLVAEAMAAGVVAESGTRMVFRHGLIRQVLYEELPTAVRAALHGQAARALAEADAPVERVAVQLMAVPEATGVWVAGWLAG